MQLPELSLMPLEGLHDEAASFQSVLRARTLILFP